MTTPSAATGLIGLLDTFALTSEEAVRQRVVDSAAENYEAEIVAIVSGDRMTEATGVGGSAVLEQAVVALAEAIGSTAAPASPGSALSTAELPGLGPVHVASLPIDDDDTSRFVLVRTGS